MENDLDIKNGVPSPMLNTPLNTRFNGLANIREDAMTISPITGPAKGLFERPRGQGSLKRWELRELMLNHIANPAIRRLIAGYVISFPWMISTKVNPSGPIDQWNVYLFTRRVDIHKDHWPSTEQLEDLQDLIAEFDLTNQQSIQFGPWTDSGSVPVGDGYKIHFDIPERMRPVVDGWMAQLVTVVQDVDYTP